MWVDTFLTFWPFLPAFALHRKKSGTLRLLMILFFVSSQFWIPLKFVSIIREELPFADILPGHPAFIIQSYGSVLSPLSGGTKTYSDTSSLEDLDQGNLSRALGSVVGIASLRAEGGVGPQLTSHTFGLLKARNTEYQTEEDKWLSSDEGTEWVLRTVDEVLDGVSSEELQDQQVKAKLWYGKKDFQTFLYIPLLNPKNNKISFKNQKESFPAPTQPHPNCPVHVERDPCRSQASPLFITTAHLK
jgi:hypothetical protein